MGLAGVVQATTYYVSPSGNDNNAGTSTSTAWQTTTKVNSRTFSPGDSILFQGGQTFTGGLVFTAGGTAASPITLSSYGTGRATIQGNLKQTVLLVDNCAGFNINNMIFRGSGNTRLSADMPDFFGIRFYAHAGAGVKFQYLRIDNVEVCDVTNRGIYFNGVGFSGFNDVRVTNCVVHNIGVEGINSSTDWPVSQASYTNFYIGDCVVYYVTGIDDMATQTGSGIVLGGVNGIVIEFCEAYNGGQFNVAGGGGPIGIWVWETENALFQFNESHHNKTQGGDGGGFDMDGGTSYSTTQYNYSHDNFGGDLIMQFARSRYAGNNIYRYNVSTNNGTYKAMGGVTIYSDAQLANVDIYNNTFYAGPDTKPEASAVAIWYWKTGGFSNINLRNNVFIAEAGRRLIYYQKISGFTFQGNLYWQSGEPLVITDGSTTYPSLAAWRTATGQEMLSGSPVGCQVSPQLTDVHSYPTLGPHNLANLTGYKLKSSSQCRDTGLNLQSLFGINPGTRDYYANSIPQGSLFDISANEYLGGGSAPAPDSTPPAAPAGLTATAASCSQINLDWADNGEADKSHYSVKRSTTTGGPYTQIISNLNASAYSDTGLVPSTPYYYVVTATDTSSNQSGNSSQASATTTAYPGAIVFSDGFESGNFTAGGWTTVGTASVTTAAKYTGTYGAKLGKLANMHKALSTVGKTNIRVRYMRSTTDTWAQMIRWFDGVNIHPIECIIGTYPWAQIDVMLGPEADNNPNFKLMFRDASSAPNGSYTYVDNVEIWGVSGGPDTTPPTPNPMTWVTKPYATGSTSIAMVATTATDPSGVSYFFDCTTTGGHDSVWQDSTSYTDTGLAAGTTYSYRVQARDKSANLNTTGWSTTESATTPAPDTTPPTPNPMTWSVLPYATGSTSIAMTATTATDPSGVEYFFDCTTTGGHDSVWQAGTSYTDTGLSPSTQYTYRVQARDKSANLNATGWSTSQSATTPAEADTTPPTPNPMTWATVPYATSSTSIAMTATTATDPSGVEYFFDETTGNPGGSDSVWQDSASYTDTGLSPGTMYTYRMQARDKSPNQNATGWSTSQSATTPTGGDTTPPSPNPMTWATVPYATGSTSIAMVATTATDASGVEYYFDETTGNPGGSDSAWQDSTSYTDTGLTPSTQYTYRVQARDKSVNQNATGWSTSQSATTQAGGGNLPFSDNFNDGDMVGWTTSGSAGPSTENIYEGAYSCKLKQTASIETSISTVGYTSIHFKYARATNSNLDAGEYLTASWYDGTNWNAVEQVGASSAWALKDWTLPSGANNNANFKIRFSINASQTTEIGYVDVVEITGTQ